MNNLVNEQGKILRGDIATARTDLLRAAELLEANGWQQGSFGEAGAPQCMSGALNSASHESARDWPEVTSRFGVAIQELQRHIEAHAIEWNDVLGRTAQQVISALRATAKNLEEES